jgi:choline dehydrogenase-like flavoprotein
VLKILNCLNQHLENLYCLSVKVGGGSAGAVVANRLSKNSKNTVLLLEAGGIPNWIMEYPAMAYVGQLKVPAVDWMFETLPQVNTSLGLNGKVSNSFINICMNLLLTKYDILLGCKNPKRKRNRRLQQLKLDVLSKRKSKGF